MKIEHVFATQLTQFRMCETAGTATDRNNCFDSLIAQAFTKDALPHHSSSPEENYIQLIPKLAPAIAMLALFNANAPNIPKIFKPLSTAANQFIITPGLAIINDDPFLSNSKQPLSNHLNPDCHPLLELKSKSTLLADAPPLPPM